MRKLRINSSRYYLEQFARSAADSLSPGAMILDAGAGDCPYKYLFTQMNYESADFCEIEKQYGEITYVCDLREIPVNDCRYDLVFCSQTLEHLPEPQGVLQEFYRILKPDGKLWLTAPLFYEEHEIPHDYYRYTQFGLRYLLDKAGFSIDSIQWLEGFYGTFSYQLNTAAQALSVSPSHYGGGLTGLLSSIITLFLKPLLTLLSFHFTYLDIRHKFTNAGQCKNYAIVASKADIQDHEDSIPGRPKLPSKNH